ncbi:MAG TPA: hypothetical protein DDZ89_19855, partial [Clostridiales bacterium]|nr:hypothetical protein [Clostridiales bacterium]
AIWHKIRSGGGSLVDAVRSLGIAYAYTEDLRYGRAGGILLDRIADFYPDFHYLLGDECHGRGWKGKVIDSIWECGTIRILAEAYDNLYPVFDDSYVIDYLHEKSKQVKMGHAKTNGTQIRNNIEDGILRTGFNAAVNGEVLGNFGFHQSAVATLAVVLDTMPESAEWIHWIMADGDRNVPISGGNIERTLIDIIDRDGMGNEASGYNVGWVGSMLKIADVLEGYDKVPAADLYGNVKFKNMFTSLAPVIAGGFYSPQIGDSGSTASTGLWMSTDIALKGFQKFGDHRFAQLAYLLNGNKLEGLRLGIMDKDPMDIQRQFDDVIAKEGTIDLKSDMMTGFGFAILRDQPSGNEAGKQDFWIYFGKNCGHGHQDTLNLGISAYDLNMAPDLGYPEMTGTQPNRLQWVSQTLSHNTVMVDGETQNVPLNNGNGGYPIHFDDSGMVKLFDVDAPNQYNSTKIYRRTLVMVKTDDQSYGVDLFRILGGNSHLYSFHSQSDEIFETEGLELIPQTDEKGNYVGSYAGSDVPYGPDPNSPKSWRYETVYPRGYTWTHTVSRDANQPKSFAIDFKVKDFNKVINDSTDLHLRMTMLSDVAFDEVATVKGHTPKKAPNKNVPDLQYVFVKREGDCLNSLFTTVYEPYKNNRTLKSVETVDMALIKGTPSSKDTARAVKVTLKNGRTDYIVYATNPLLTYRIADLFDFRGFVGVYAVKNGRLQFKYINDGDLLDGKVMVHGALTGKVIDITRKLQPGNEVIIKADQDVDADALAGKFIFVDNDKVENGAYRIIKAKQLPDGNISLGIGDVSLIRGFSKVPGEEYEYNILPDQTFRIPLAYMMNDVTRK